ncbi:MAG TPA: hypothetical protein VEW46_02955 [Pyrinomonadaceae bacterium]|nr:hypothetical protein [Pyrinomonadaceae bacterium]
MNRIVALGVNDLKNIFRDRTLTLIFFVPFVIIVLLRFGMPVLAEHFPVIVGYYPPILAFFCYMIVTFPAFLISFIMLDEKDEDVLTVIRVMPFSLPHFVAYRVLLILILGTVFSTLTILLSRLVQTGLLVAFSISVLFALTAPVITLTVVTFARNKIEGLSILKGLSTILMLPLLSFFINSSWKLVLSVIPVFWTYMAFKELSINMNYVLYLSVGMAFHALLLAVLYRRFKDKA